MTRVLQTTQQAQEGDSLELTVDVQTQRIAEKALKWAMNLAGIKRGVFIVMNPQTGEILAMVSLPDYNDNAFANGISTADYQKLLRDPNNPLHNFAIQDSSRRDRPTSWSRVRAHSRTARSRPKP